MASVLGTYERWPTCAGEVHLHILPKVLLWQATCVASQKS